MQFLACVHVHSSNHFQKGFQIQFIGLVDGVITSDGDAFLYGAHKVYRNLSISEKEPSIEFYDRDEINKKLHLSREDLICFGILVGCDYIPKGVPGIGKEGALKFLSAVLKPLHLFNEAHKLQNDSSHCLTCRHEGTDHEENGCSQCRTSVSCYMNSKSLCSCRQHSKLTLSNHYIILTLEKCTQLEEFPFKPIVKEFIDSRARLKLGEKLEFRCPSLQKFKAFTSLVYMWEPNYCLQQAVLNAVAFQNNHQNCEIANGSKKDGCYCSEFNPVKIVKARKKNFETCVEVQWSVPEVFRKCFDEIQINDNAVEMRTVEPVEIICEKFSELWNEYESQKVRSKKENRKPTKRSAKNKAMIENGDENIDDNCVVSQEENQNNELLNDSLKFLNLESPSKMRKTQEQKELLLSKTPKQKCNDMRVSGQNIGNNFLLDNRKNNHLKRYWCFSPSSDQAASQPVCSAPRITSTPYRALSPNSFFQSVEINGKHNFSSSPIASSAVNSAKIFKPQIAPSPYLDVAERIKNQQFYGNTANINMKESAKPERLLLSSSDENEDDNLANGLKVEKIDDVDGKSSDSEIEAMEVPMAPEVELRKQEKKRKALAVAHKLILDDSDDDCFQQPNGVENEKVHDSIVNKIALNRRGSNQLAEYDNEDQEDEDDIVCLEDVPLMERLKKRKESCP